jgi:hypothetical protein
LPAHRQPIASPSPAHRQAIASSSPGRRQLIAIPSPAHCQPIASSSPAHRQIIASPSPAHHQPIGSSSPGHRCPLQAHHQVMVMLADRFDGVVAAVRPSYSRPWRFADFCFTSGVYLRLRHSLCDCLCHIAMHCFGDLILSSGATEDLLAAGEKVNRGWCMLACPLSVLLAGRDSRDWARGGASWPAPCPARPGCPKAVAVRTRTGVVHAGLPTVHAAARRGLQGLG